MKNEKDKAYSNFVLKLMLICTILILGSAIVFSFSSFYNDHILKEEPIEIDDPNVKRLYDYVTYGRDLEPMYYFFRNKELTYDTFDEVEKMRYAFQLITNDDIFDKDEVSFKILGDSYKRAIEKIFGINTKYNINSQFTIYINNFFKNAIVNVSYNQEGNYFLVARINNISNNNNIPKLFYTKLDSYHIDSMTKDITIKEKVIFTETLYSNNLSQIDTVMVYRDLNHIELLKEIKNPTRDQIKSLSIKPYLNVANTITYTFKQDEEGNYYFYNSVMAY